uniref:transketolase C-terminal domain-containing protein n=1 Tax=Serratia quinivorans TaxID=137545 RepID=UPI0035C77B6F
MQNKASLSPLIIITALFAALSGLYLLGGGIWLAKLGGSLYYIIAGLVLLVTAWLLARRRATALLLYAVFLLGTTIWALWEVGPDFWALTPRLDVTFFFGLWLVLPFIYHKLIASGKKGKLIHVATLKPFNQQEFYALVADCPQIATLENHTVNGGLGGQVAEAMAQAAHPARLTRLGTQDTFTESGNSRQLKAKYGIS